MYKGIVKSTLLLDMTFAFGSTIAVTKCSVGRRTALSANLTSYVTMTWANMDFCLLAAKKCPGLTHSQWSPETVGTEEHTTHVNHAKRANSRSSRHLVLYTFPILSTQVSKSEKLKCAGVFVECFIVVCRLNSCDDSSALWYKCIVPWRMWSPSLPCTSDPLLANTLNGCGDTYCCQSLWDVGTPWWSCLLFALFPLQPSIIPPSQWSLQPSPEEVCYIVT